MRGIELIFIPPVRQHSEFSPASLTLRTTYGDTSRCSKKAAVRSHKHRDGRSPVLLPCSFPPGLHPQGGLGLWFFSELLTRQDSPTTGTVHGPQAPAERAPTGFPHIEEESLFVQIYFPPQRNRSVILPRENIVSLVTRPTLSNFSLFFQIKGMLQIVLL